MKKAFTLLIISTLSVIFIPVYGQNLCTEAVSDAERELLNGRFKEALNRLESCYKNLTYIEKVEARKIKAKCYTGDDSVSKAVEEIEQLLYLKPDFEPAYDDSPLFVNLVREVRLRLNASQTSSVSKKAEKIETAPAAVTVISQEDIRRRGYRHLEALFHDLSGFDISRSAGLAYANIYQRGYRSAANTDRTLLLIDGVEDNGLWSNTAFISRQYAMSNIKRVEIIYGPASTMYGPNAFQGVINVITKDDLDVFGNDKNWAVSGQAGYGTYNSHYADVTASFRGKDLSVSVTGRYFRSDERDLSAFSYWDYVWEEGDDAFYTQKLGVVSTAENPDLAQNYLDQNGLNPDGGKYYSTEKNGEKVDAIYPNAEGISRAQSTDKTGYGTDSRGRPVQYSNPTDDKFLAIKFKLHDLKIGMQYWDRNEGAASTYADQNLYSGSENGVMWTTRQWFLYMKYDKWINSRMYLSWFTRYKSHGFYPDTRIAFYQSFYRGNLDLADLENGRTPWWNDVYFHQASRQLRSELKLSYSITERLSAVAGAEFRNSLIQGDYVKTSVTDPSVYSGSAIVDSVRQVIENPILNGIHPDKILGGNMYDGIDFGAYLQANLRAHDNLQLTFGGRIDNNSVREGFLGYGTVFNPRLAAVFTPGKLIFKAIYSEAFKDASAFNKYSTSLIRGLSSPNIRPEKVANFELSGRYTSGNGFFAELITYFADYNGTLKDVVVPFGTGTTTQFQARGKSRVLGLQVNSGYRRGNYDFYANYTFSDSRNTDEDLPAGDIARHQLNLGVNGQYLDKRLNINVRANIVGAKKTGEGTTVSANPLSEVPAYTLINSAISYKISQQLTARLIIDNLADLEFNHPGIRSASLKPYAPVTPQDRRNIHLDLLFDF